MIDIRIEGESVDLFNGTRLTLEGFNPMLDFTKVPGSRVYGFSLPDTPKNRRILGFFNQAQIPYVNRKFYAEKYVNSQLIERGYVMIQDAPAGSYNLYFTQNLGEVFGDLQTALLPDINLGSMVLPATLETNPDLATASAVFPMIENPAMYGNQGVGGFNGIINRFDNGQYDTVGRVPMMPLQWLLNAFGELTGWQFGGSFLQDADIRRLLLYNLYSLDGPGGSVNTITFQNHLPLLTFPGMVMALRQLFNLYIEFDVRRKVASMDLVDDLLKAEVKLDWSAKVAPEHTKVPDLQNRLELSYNIDTNDAFMKPIPAEFDKYTTAETAQTLGGSVTPIRSAFSTLLTNPATGLAMTSQPGISPNNKDNTNPTGPKLLFFNGLVDGKPVATNASGGKALTWSGPGNLVDTYWRQFERFKANTFLIRKAVVWTPADLAQFRFRNKVHIRGVNYMVGSYKAVLGVDANVIPAELELWKI
ncbi:hypothetical protein [Spirosoma endbachense]|uniref:Uncharacterized protein n=1 Tax=Spirosoma endbachense TaxID=2666025 RepID=A0A6P1W2M4_9BACT|nr:hypothetical protein [Spirosoma endbachense]QHV97936.1 hypothetical protein GJR95_24300 [Spirosoma endbachense]